MKMKDCTIKEIVLLPDDETVGVEDVAKFIDDEIKLERIGEDGNPVKVDSVSIGFEGIEAKLPFVRSGNEFCEVVRSLRMLLGR